MQKLNRSLTSASLVLLCIWPALYNRQPLMFADTTAYVRGAAVGFERFLHQDTVWSDDGSRSRTTSAATYGKAMTSHKPVLAGRSIYYGSILYISQLVTDQFWAAIVLQSLAVFISIALTLKAFGLLAIRVLAFMCIFLAFLTPMAFFVSYLMPDIFAAIAILAVGNLTVSGYSMTNSVLAVWWCLLTAAMLFHSSNICIAILLQVGIVFYRLVARKPIPWKAVFVSAVAMFVALGGEALFSEVTKKATGDPPIRPPFLTARLVADGPGQQYLAYSCPQSGFELCKYLSRITALKSARVTRPISDEFLWNIDPGLGVFSAVDPRTQEKLVSEDPRFVWSTVAFDSAGVIGLALRNALRQVQMFGLNEFELDAGGRGFFSRHLPAPVLKSLQNSRNWTNTLPTQGLSLITYVVVAASAFLLVLCFLLWTPLSFPQTGERALSLIISMGLLSNAVVCGCLSVPHDRYQSRVIWLLPFAALLLLTKAFKTLRIRAGFAIVPKRIVKANQREPLPV